jgi:hypothetical protein
MVHQRVETEISQVRNSDLELVDGDECAGVIEGAALRQVRAPVQESGLNSFVY